MAVCGHADAAVGMDGSATQRAASYVSPAAAVSAAGGRYVAVAGGGRDASQTARGVGGGRTELCSRAEGSGRGRGLCRAQPLANVVRAGASLSERVGC